MDQSRIRRAQQERLDSRKYIAAQRFAHFRYRSSEKRRQVRVAPAKSKVPIKMVRVDELIVCKKRFPHSQLHDRQQAG